MSTISNRVERAILRHLITSLSAAGYNVAAVYIDGEGSYVMADADSTKGWTEDSLENFGARVHNVSRTLTVDQVESVMFEVFDLLSPTIHFTHRGSNTWGDRGVMVVLGNGEDFISDYHCGDDAFSSIVDAVSEAASEGRLLLQMPQSEAPAVPGQHTPGPWMVSESAQNFAVPRGEHLARAERQANARLIAAAPEILVALKGLRDAFKCCIGSQAFAEFEESNAAVILANGLLAVHS